MSRNHIYNKVSTKQRLTLLGLLFLCIAGNVKAQEAPLYVIKMEGQNNYLSHSGSGTSATLQNATAFSPNCLWYSGPNVEYNYYFIDEDGNYRYLSAPLALNGELYLTPTYPGTVVLNIASSGQYFYDWDDGLARGEEISIGVDDCNTLYNGYSDGQCWKVVWVSYEEFEGNMRWQMSSQYGYNPTTYAARFMSVTKTEHPVEILETPAPTGGLPTIADFAMTYSADPLATHALDGTATPFSCTYRPAYTTYVFEGGTHNYYGDNDHGTDIPNNSTLSSANPVSYAWTLTGEGAQYLSLSADNVANPTLTYHTENTTTSHKMATLTLTATYEGGVKQVRTITVTVKAECQNPIQASAPVVTYNDVTLSWVPTAEKYRLQWKQSGQDWSVATEVADITASGYLITGSAFTALGYGQAYDYRVSAYCNSGYLDYPEDANLIYHFSTFAEPGLFIFGSVYGGGRMANVNGNTEVVVIDCDSVKAVYGGNDIAGTVSGMATITLGANADDANATAYNNGNASTKVRVFDVYGGGNGYYAYNGTSFTAASSEYYQQTVAAGGEVKAMTQTNQVGEVVWTNTETSPVTLTFPKISQSRIVMTNDVVRVDSLFGGAKNAFLTYDDWHYAGDSIAIKGGTTYALFGGNNIGGGQGKGKHHIEVNNTKVNPTATSGFGRCFGIGYLFGGGNKVFGSTTEIFITGGQCDTVFAGGNSASVYAANVTVNSPVASDEGNIYSFYSNLIDEFYKEEDTYYQNGDSIVPKTDYAWDGYSGVYNVRTLFGGNNRAKMEVVPYVTLTSGSVGTVYGGGNAGDMMAQVTGGSITFPGMESEFDSYSFAYSTKVVMNSPTMLVDYLYGGCQMSNVGFSSWVQFQDGHVGTIYGGCNISGDVGSTRVHLDANANNADGRYQEVHGATYVEASGGVVHKNVFAGSNGFYHCLEILGIYYKDGITYDPLGHSYVGMKVPTHNETHVVIRGTTTVEQNVYAGGNMAPVGFTTTYVNNSPDVAYPYLVGLASVRMIGGEVKGNVYGGGCMASINGSNEVRVTGGSIGTGPNGGALYGGNDRLGKAGASGMSNRKMPDIYSTASDHHTPLVSDDENKKVVTYVGVSGNPQINTVYGGGNGAYKYTGPEADMQYCDDTDLPIQTNIFVDIAIDGGDDGGYITNVYGGGNGVYAEGFVKVFLNVRNCSSDTRNHIGTIYGGNNMGDMEDVVPEIILLNGNVNTVYGGCNSGAMAATGNKTKSFTVGTTTYSNIGSYVRLLDDYEVTNTTLPEPITYHTTPTAKVTGAVYGGCRMNDVTNNSLVLVEAGDHSTANMFGGCDISGTISGNSYVVVTGGQMGNIYGGGNGNYYYADDHHVYQIDNHSVLVASNGNDDPAITAPACAISQVDILGGQVGATGTGNDRSVFGGGWGAATSTTGNVTVNFGANGAQNEYPKLYGNIYGGSALGSVNTNASNTTTVNVLNGTLNGDIFGGGLGEAGAENVAKGQVNGKVYVNIGAVDDSGSTPVYSGNATINGSVFGCNNTNGSPQDDVFVNIYKTAHGSSPEANLYPNNPPSPYTELNVAALAANAALPQRYAIEAVYGGGNLAAYTPVADKSSTVHVYSCDNTIQSVFGGGNSADVGKGVASDLTVTQRANTNVIIEGGRIHRVIGGGNGEVTSLPAANIFGTASTIVYAGLIDEVYGGANIRGSVDGINLIMSNPNQSLLSNCNDEVYGAVFGCANAAPYNKSVITTIECGVGTIGELYGGSNQNYIGSPTNHNSGAHVTLNIYGGEYINVFAGSKGVAGSSGVAADIYGDVTLNLYGGTITNAFGGSDANGNITGNITVNVLDFEETNCGLDVTNIYGASNQTAYAPDDGGTRVSPVVNVMHISQAAGVKGNVFGGGNEALVTSNPEVNIGYYAATMSSLIPTNYPDTSSFYTTPRGYVKTNVYGGGNEAGVTGDPVINIRDKGTVVTGIYGGCNTNGDVDGDINVNIYGGTLGTSSEAMTDGIFGGGRGHATGTNGNTTVTINKETSESTAPEIYADVYGGSALGEVGATDKTAKVHLIAGTVNGNVFGGGKGEGTAASTQATVTGNTNVTIEGGTLTSKVNSYVYGGCNINGNVVGNITVDANGGTVSNDLFGGGQGSVTTTQGNVTVTIDGGTIGNDVYGGSALGQVNNETADLTKVNLKSGTVTGNLYGGGMGDVVDHTDIWGQVNGNVEVHVNGGTVTGSVFGCNNYNEQPAGTVKVYINETTAGTMSIGGNVYGGGNVAYYDGTPEVYIQNGTIDNKVFGGGNNISIANKGVGGSNVQMTGGTVLGGIYGGCYTDGDVTGNSMVTITGGTIGATGVGKEGHIFGGGYGEATKVAGNVTVTFGNIDAAPSDNPKLIGDLYGGSALGNVNTATSDVTPYTTTIYIYNGEITGPNVGNVHLEDNVYGNVFGGGLGQRNGVNGATSDIAAMVYGKVYVNIGKTDSPPSGSLSGQATLINCNVFGCNNENGSPQDDVVVNVYKTAHIQGTNTVEDHEFAIMQVFGGGNRANYAPENNNENSEKKTHVYIHGCENTVKYVYGGSNAADAVGVVTLVGGGHFDEIFGGGNGAFGAANIGKGGIGLNVMGGRVSYLYAGSNKHGTNNGPSYEVAPLDGFIDCGDLVVESFFFGDNEAEHYGDIVHTITCEEAANFHYTKLYGGSRWAIVYGDIKLTVCGGIIESLFGGSMGYAINQIPAHVRMFPSMDSITADLERYPYPGSDTTLRKYSYDLREFMNYDPVHPEYYKTNLVGKGGNIELIITGGTIGEAIGGCDELGNVEGKITVIVDDAENLDCPLYIGNIYGASDYTYYRPCDYEDNQVYYDPTGTHGNAVIPTPQVIIVKVKEATGVAYDFNGNGITGAAETFAGNIYGGANRGDITSNPRVTIGDGTTGSDATKVTIGGDVYGGGNIGNVIGSPQVVVVPKRHKLTFDNHPTGGTFTVSYPRGISVSSDSQIGEGIALRLVATPAAPQGTTGYVFKKWTVNGTGASVGSTTSANTLFTMGTTDATVSATFEEKDAYMLTISGSGGSGTYTVDGNAYDSPVYVVETASATVHVTPNDGFAFDYWEVSGAGASVSSTQSATTVFTMGTAIATLTAHFKTAYQLNLVANNAAYGSFKVNGVNANSVWLAENEIATVVAVPKPAIEIGGVWKGYLFNGWEITSGGTGSTLSSTTSASITFKMGTQNTDLNATFNEVSAHALTMQAVAGGTVGTGGSFKVNGANYTEPVWIAQGATVPIVATPAVGYRFKRWINNEANGTIGDLNAAYTVFTMGSGDTHIVIAEFEAIATHVFAFTSDPAAGGSITVTDSDGNPVVSGAEIREGATLNIVATPESGYRFTGWEVTEGNGVILHTGNPSTTFTMGTADATIQANFELIEP